MLPFDLAQLCRRSIVRQRHRNLASARGPFRLAQAEDRPGGRYQRPLNEVLELPDVAGPVLILEVAEHAGRDGLDRLPETPTVLVHEVMREQRYVLFALSQRWKLDYDRIDAIVEIGTETAGAHGMLNVAVGRREQPNVRVNRIRDCIFTVNPFCIRRWGSRIRLKAGAE